MVAVPESYKKILTANDFARTLREYGFDRAQRNTFYEASNLRTSRQVVDERFGHLSDYAEALRILVKRSGLEPNTINRLVRNWVRQRAFDLNVADVVSSADFYDSFLKQRRFDDAFPFRTPEQGTVFDQLQAARFQAELMEGSN